MERGLHHCTETCGAVERTNTHHTALCKLELCPQLRLLRSRVYTNDAGVKVPPRFLDVNIFWCYGCLSEINQ